MNAKESRDRFETCLYSKITMFSEIFNIYLLKNTTFAHFAPAVNYYLLIFICAIREICGFLLLTIRHHFNHPLTRLPHHDLNLRCQGRHFYQ